MRLITAAVGFALGLALRRRRRRRPRPGPTPRLLRQWPRSGRALAGRAISPVRRAPRRSDADANGAFGELVAQAMRLTQIETEMRVSTWLDPSVSGVNRRDLRRYSQVTTGSFRRRFSASKATITFGRLSSSATESLSTVPDDGPTASHQLRDTGDGHRRGRAEELGDPAGAGRLILIGAFLPFVTGGLAVAEYESRPGPRGVERPTRFATRRTGVSQCSRTSPSTRGSSAEAAAATRWALASGAGIDVALTQKRVPPRGWEYPLLPDRVPGTEVLREHRARSSCVKIPVANLKG